MAEPKNPLADLYPPDKYIVNPQTGTVRPRTPAKRRAVILAGPATVIIVDDAHRVSFALDGTTLIDGRPLAWGSDGVPLLDGQALKSYVTPSRLGGDTMPPIVTAEKKTT